ncbi:unnamed protein product [Lactuca saligna]|uniref:Uncharacterized protein n=1 Tax=Lactuca saligna TaxID=75948 RepID=A0AA35V9D8_LACSI|nr:unnamed protein product [Lactuca saligna]
MFLLVLAPPTFDLRLAPPHRPTLSSVTQTMEPLIFGNHTSPALASNIRSGDLRVTASIAQIYKPYVLLRYVFLDSNFSMFSFFYKILMAYLLSIFVLLVFVLHVASESMREVLEQIDGEEFTEELLFRPLPDQKALSDFHFENFLLPAIPSGPSFRDFVVWKGETATPTPAPAWSNDSGKIARHTSLRYILKEQENKGGGSSVQQQQHQVDAKLKAAVEKEVGRIRGLVGLAFSTTQKMNEDVMVKPCQ